MEEKPSFLKNHADTFVIVGINVAIFSLLLAICLSNISSIAAVNSRIDTLHMMFYDLLKETRR